LGGRADVPPQERESSWLEDFRDFAWRSLRFLDEGKVRNLKPSEVLFLLQNYWDTPASFEHFKEMVATYGQIPAGIDFATLWQDALTQYPDLYDDFLEYLVGKLPYELQEEWRKKIRDKKNIESLIDAVSRDDSGLDLGFHTSPIDFWAGEGDTTIKPTFSEDEFINTDTKEKRTDASAKTWYSTNPKELYPGKISESKTPWIYLVEVSRGDKKTKRFYDKSKGAFYTHGSLVVRHRLPLTPEVMESLGIRLATWKTV
jgi:hypothetical protein